MSLYQAGLGNPVKTTAALVPVEKPQGPVWFGPLMMTVLGGVIVYVITKGMDKQRGGFQRAESMWVKR